MTLEELMPKFVEKSKKYNVGIGDITVLFNAELEKSKANKDISDENKELSAWLRTQLILEMKYGVKPERDTSTPRSEPADLEGFLVGFGDFRDKKAEMVRFIERFVKNSGKTQAQQRGYIKTDGVTVINLDYRDQVFGRANPNKGKPLSEVEIANEMKLYGVFRRNDSEDAFVFGTLETTNSAIANSWFKSLKFPEHIFLPMKTNGNIRETELGFRITASASEDKVTKFTVDKNPSYKVDVAFMEAVGPLITPWAWEDNTEEGIPNPLYQHYLDALSAGKKNRDGIQQPDFNRMIFVRGVIDSIRPEWKNFKGTPAYICDENDVGNRVKVFLPEGFERMFGEGSIVVLYGKDDETMRKNEATQKWDIPSGKIEIRCVGAYPIPGFKTAPVDASKVKLKEFNAVVMQ